MASVLIVDDEEDVVEFLTTALETEGFDVRGATSALQALLQIQKDKPQVLLLDLMMPQVTGEELCRIIKNDPDLFDIHIIILSARTDMESKIACLDGGADDYLVKPIHAKELVARLKSFFRLIHGLQSRPNLTSVTGPTPKPGANMDLSPDTATVPRIRPKYGIYRVESLVGSGGMGHVFKGQDEVLERPVAIKVLSPALSSSPRVVERFRREAKILASTDHPGIASIYSFGEEGGDYYFAMQWLPGGSVMDLVQKNHRLPLLTVIDIALQCIDALSAALAKGIVHRDVKPSNMMLDQNQRIKLVDFGLATADRMPTHVTQASEIFGTPDYIAPEQAQFGSVDHRADIYSLGISLYYMLYGRLPFTAKSAIDMVVKHATEPFPDYDPLDGAVPRDIYEILQSMTQKTPEDRYQDYSSCRRDLLLLRDEIYSSTGVLLPRVENVSPTPIWDSKNLAEVLSALYVNPHPGVLTVSSGDEQFRFYVERQHILFLDAPDAEENLWQVLLENNLIKKEEVPPVGSDFQEHLMRFLMRQAFGFEDLKRIHRQYLKAVWLELGSRPGFAAKFQSAEILNDDLGGVFVGDVLLELARATLPLEQIGNYFGVERQLSRTAEFDHVLSSLSLNREESFIASRFEEDHVVSLESLVQMTGFPEELVTRFVFVLAKLGACRFKPQEKRPRKMDGSDELEPEQALRISDQFHQLALQELEQGNYWKVTELCRQAIRHDPGRAKHYHLMGLAFAHHPRFLNDAEQCFLKAIEREPQEIAYRISYVYFLSRQNQIQRAVEECEKALELEPEHPEALTLSAELQAKLPQS